MARTNPAAQALIEALKAPDLEVGQRNALLAALQQALTGTPTGVKRAAVPPRAEPEPRRPAPARMRLSREAIVALELPERGERLVYDTMVPALAVRLRPGGRTYVVVAWDKARRRKTARTLGKPATLTPEQARDKARKLVADLAIGEDIRRERTEGQTIEQLIGAWHAEKSRSTRTADEMRDKALDHLGKLRTRVAADLTREDIGQIHHAIATKGRRRVRRRVGEAVRLVPVGAVGTPATADKWLAIMSSVYNWGEGRGLVASNPCKGIGKAFNVKAASRSSYLHGEPLLRFWQALEDDPDADVRDVLLLALYTGQRKGNVLAMRWDDVDLDAGLWTIPAESTKQKTAQTNPLSGHAREILARRFDDAATVWVFPAARRGADGGLGHMTESRPRDAWERICKVADITDVRIHDLRHTAGSWLARLGANEAIRQKALGHQTSAMAARYSHLELDPVADAMERMGAAITAAATKRPATVRKLRGAK